MNIQSPKTMPTDITANPLNDEIDLRRVVLVLFSWWREMLLITTAVIAVVLGGVLLLRATQPPTYMAGADLLIARLASDVQLDERISTTNTGTAGDNPAGRSSLMELTKSSTIAQKVIAELGTELPTELSSPDKLIEAITVENPNAGDARAASSILRIHVVTEDRDLSARIANAWANHTIEFINGLYGEVPNSTLQTVGDELAQAKATYDATEVARQAFIADNNIAFLQREIDRREALHASITVNYNQALTSVIASNYSVRINLFNLAANYPIRATGDLLELERAEDLDRIRTLYRIRQQLRLYLEHARNMEATLLAGGAASAKSNVQALQLLKIATLTTVSSQPLPDNLPIMLTDQTLTMSAEEQIADLRALIATLETYLTSIDADIASAADARLTNATPPIINELLARPTGLGVSLPQTYTDALNAAYNQVLMLDNNVAQMMEGEPTAAAIATEELLQRVEAETREMRAQLAALQQQEEEFDYARDQAWVTYDALNKKLQELRLLQASANSELRLASPAVPPSEPVPVTQIALPIGAAALAGLLISILIAFFVDFMGGEPFLSRRAATMAHR